MLLALHSVPRPSERLWFSGDIGIEEKGVVFLGLVFFFLGGGSLQQFFSSFKRVFCFVFFGTPIFLNGSSILGETLTFKKDESLLLGVRMVSSPVSGHVIAGRAPRLSISGMVWPWGEMAL